MTANTKALVVLTMALAALPATGRAQGGPAGPGGPAALVDLGDALVDGRLRFTLPRLVSIASRFNSRAVFEQLGWQVSGEALAAERGIYDPQAYLSIGRDHVNKPNTATEYYDRSLSNTFRERAYTARTGVEGLLPTGARWSVDYRYFDRGNDLVRQRYQDRFSREYEGVFEITLRQPLLRDAGESVTTTRIQIAQIEREIAFERYRLRIMEVAGGVVGAYWDLFLAQRVLAMREESVKIAARVLADADEKVNAGRAARQEALEARAGLAQRRTDMLAARLEVVSATSRIRGLLNLGADSRELPIEAAEPQFMPPNYRVSVDESLNRAIANWPEYVMAVKANRQDVLRLEYARNQELPQLDARASVGTAGLGVRPRTAVGDTGSTRYPSWSVGLEYRIPLQNTQAEANTRASVLRERQSFLERQALEQALANTLRVRAEKVRQTSAELTEQRDASRLRRTLLDTEFARMQEGLSRVRDVLVKEEELNAAMLTELRSLIEYEKSIAALQLAEGTLLDRYGVRLELSADADPR